MVMEESLQRVEAEKAHEARADGDLRRDIEPLRARDRVRQQVEECRA